MVKGNKASIIQKSVTAVILALSLAALAVCAWIGISLHSRVDTETLSEITPEYVHNGMLQIIVAFCLLAATGVFMYFCKKISRRQAVAIVLIAAVIATAGAVIWNRISPYGPIADQKEILNAVIRYGRRQYSEISASYFDSYHNQMGFVVFFGFLFRHLPVDALAMITVCNCVAVGGIVCGTALLGFELFQDYCLAALAAWMTAVFMPIVIYSNFCYGTLLSLCCVIQGFVWLLMWFRRRKFWMAVASAGFFTISYVVYSGSLIAILAAAVALLVDCPPPAIRRNWREAVIHLLVIVMVTAVPIMAERGTEREFCRVTGVSREGGIPAAAFIVMGITSESERGPGTYDGTNLYLYETSDRNSELAEKAANGIIQDTVQDFANGKRSLHFFWDKLTYEWSDPWFSSLIMTTYKWDKDIEASSQFFQKLMSDACIRGVENLLSGYTALIYGLALLGMAYCAFKRKDKEKGSSGLMVLLPVYFLGGVLFYLIWEAKPRYVLPYFVCLIPYAVYGGMRVVGAVLNCCLGERNR